MNYDLSFIKNDNELEFKEKNEKLFITKKFLNFSVSSYFINEIPKIYNIFSISKEAILKDEELLYGYLIFLYKHNKFDIIISLSKKINMNKLNIFNKNIKFIINEAYLEKKLSPSLQENFLYFEIQLNLNNFKNRKKNNFRWEKLKKYPVEKIINTYFFIAEELLRGEKMDKLKIIINNLRHYFYLTKDNSVFIQNSYKIYKYLEFLGEKFTAYLYLKESINYKAFSEKDRSLKRKIINILINEFNVELNEMKDCIVRSEGNNFYINLNIKD